MGGWVGEKAYVPGAYSSTRVVVWDVVFQINTITLEPTWSITSKSTCLVGKGGGWMNA